MIDATLAVVLAVRSGAARPPCETVFPDVATARCLAPAALGHQVVRPTG